MATRGTEPDKYAPFFLRARACSHDGTRARGKQPGDEIQSANATAGRRHPPVAGAIERPVAVSPTKEKLGPMLLSLIIAARMRPPALPTLTTATAVALTPFLGVACSGTDGSAATSSAKKSTGEPHGEAGGTDQGAGDAPDGSASNDDHEGSEDAGSKDGNDGDDEDDDEDDEEDDDDDDQEDQEDQEDDEDGVDQKYNHVEVVR